MLHCFQRCAAAGVRGDGAPLLSSFSVELIAPRNVSCGKAFHQAYEHIRRHSKLGFVTIGGVGPLMENNHVAALMERRLREEKAGDRTPLCINVMCTGTDARALDRCLMTARDFDINGLCVLRGRRPNVTAPPSASKAGEGEEDAFVFPSDMLRHIRQRQEDDAALRSIVLAAGATPFRDAARSKEDWDYVEEKIRNGADAIFATPGINMDNHVMSRWLSDACLRPVHLRQTSDDSSDATSPLPRSVFAVPCALSAISPKLLSKMAASRMWVVPDDLDGPMRVGLLPPHPNSSLDPDAWEANTARVFRRIMTEYTAKHLKEYFTRTASCCCPPTSAEREGQAPLEDALAAQGQGPVAKLQIPKHVHIVAYENCADDVLRLVDSIQ